MKKPQTMLLRFAIGCSLLLAFLGAAPESSPDPGPVPSTTPSPNAAAERMFARAKEVWRARKDVPYVRYGALVRYLHTGHVFDNWWDTFYRSRDAALSLQRLVDVDEDRRRLRGVPFSIFGVKIFDTNPDAEPIRLDEPRIDPSSSFGVADRVAAPSASSSPSAAGATSGDGELRTITRVESNERRYQVEVAGTDEIIGAPALHLTLRPLSDPKIYRLRDLWLDPATYRTVQLNVQGLLNGQPYDEILWTVRYVVVEGRQYVQQIVADEPLRFGIDTIVPKFEFDFVDYHFPADVPQFTFDRPF